MPWAAISNAEAQMAAQPERPQADKSVARTRPIELLTENGFVILRPWEIDGVPAPTPGTYHFRVRNPQNVERDIIVEVADAIVARVAIQTGGRILLQSSFWICCAERHLANYVWEIGDYPVNNKLRVEQLDPEDIMSALRWRKA